MLYKKFVKRFLDIVLSSLALAALALPMAIVALLVRVHLGSPVIFRQQRIGRNNAPFNLLKFRTMSDERGRDGIFLPDEERLVPFGKFLRNTSIDELPSLINIIRGEMSIIGPRPLPTRYLPRYTQAQLRRHEVRPGLSNVSVVRGRNAQSWEDQFEMDVWYVDHVSFGVDLKSVFSTLRIVFTCLGATSGDGGARREFIGTADINKLNNEDKSYMKL